MAAGTHSHDPERRTVTVEIAARMLGIGRQLAYELVRVGRFPTPVIRVGRRVVIPREPFERALRGEAPVEERSR
jgi:excisionase family DNA binding protein